MLYEIQDVIYNLFLRVLKRRTFFYQNGIFIRRGKEVRHHSRKERIVFKIVRKGKKKPGSSGYCSQGRRGGPRVPSFEGSALRWIRSRIIINGKNPGQYSGSDTTRRDLPVRAFKNSWLSSLPLINKPINKCLQVLGGLPGRAEGFTDYQTHFCSIAYIILFC